MIYANDDLSLMFTEQYLKLRCFHLWKLFIHENSPENIVCEMAAILSRGR